MASLKLIPIEVDGSVGQFTGVLPELAVSVLYMTSQMYAKSGFVTPWIGYLAVRDAKIVGTCGFKSPPRENEVEIAYFTFPEYEGLGVATEMAPALVELAVNESPNVLVTAQTLIERNASHRILEKVGFVTQMTMENPEDGTVLVWHHPI